MARGGALLVVSKLITQVFSWAVTVQVAGLLQPYDYGILAIGGIFMNVADLLADVGVGKALVQKDRVDSDDVAQTFTLGLLFATVLYLILILVARPASHVLEIPELVDFLQLAGLVLLTIPFRAVPMALLDRRIQIGRQSTFIAITTIIQSCLVLGLAYAGFGYWALVIGTIAGRTLESIVLAGLVHWTPQLRRPSGFAIQAFSFGIKVSAASFLWYFYTNADFVVVGKLNGTVELGYYSLAFQLISLPVQKISSVYGSIAYPVYCRMQGEPDLVRSWHLRSITLMMVIGAPALVGMTLVANDAIPLLLGDKWRPSVIPLQFLSVGGFFMIIHGSMTPFFLGSGRPDIHLKCSVVFAAVLPAAFALSGMYYGMLGVCLIWVTVYPLILLGVVFFTRPVTGFGVIDFGRSLAPVVAALALMTIAVISVRGLIIDPQQRQLRLGVAITIGVLTYSGALWILMKQVLLRDLRTVKNSLRKT